MATGDVMVVPVQHELVQHVAVHTLCMLHMNIFNTCLKSDMKTMGSITDLPITKKLITEL